MATELDAGLTTNYESPGTFSVTSSRELTQFSSVTKQDVATESDVDLTTAYKSPGITSLRRLSLATQQETESNKPITYYVSTESDAESSKRLSSVTQQEKESDKLITYIAGTFSALLLIALLGVMALALLFASHVHHQRKKTSKLHGSIHILLYPIN